jgi:hypothetical protein
MALRAKQVTARVGHPSERDLRSASTLSVVSPEREQTTASVLRDPFKNCTGLISRSEACTALQVFPLAAWKNGATARLTL